MADIKNVEEFEVNGRKVVVAKLPVSEPAPIEKPNKNIQLPPIVQPMAVIPFVSFDGEPVSPNAEYTPEDNGEYSQQPAEAPAYDNYQPYAQSYAQPAYYAPQSYPHDDKVKQFGEKARIKSTKKSARASGFIMMLFSLVALVPFILAYLKKSINLGNVSISAPNIISDVLAIAQDFGAAFQGDNINTSLPTLIIALGAVLIVIGFIVGFFGLVGGKRPRYGLLGIIVFLLMVIGEVLGFYFENGDFSQINEMLGDAQFITVIGIGILYALLGIISSAIYAKNEYIEE